MACTCTGLEHRGSADLLVAGRRRRQLQLLQDGRVDAAPQFRGPCRGRGGHGKPRRIATQSARGGDAGAQPRRRAAAQSRARVGDGGRGAEAHLLVSSEMCDEMKAAASLAASRRLRGVPAPLVGFALAGIGRGVPPRGLDVRTRATAGGTRAAATTNTLQLSMHHARSSLISDRERTAACLPDLESSARIADSVVPASYTMLTCFSASWTSTDLTRCRRAVRIVVGRRARGGAHTGRPEDVEQTRPS